MKKESLMDAWIILNNNTVSFITYPLSIISWMLANPQSTMFLLVLQMKTLSFTAGMWPAHMASKRRSRIWKPSPSGSRALIMFSIVQLVLLFSHSVESDSATPRTAAHQASLSFTISQSLLKLMSNESGSECTSSQLLYLLYLSFLLSHVPKICFG